MWEAVMFRGVVVVVGTEMPSEAAPEDIADRTHARAAAVGPRVWDRAAVVEAVVEAAVDAGRG